MNFLGVATLFGVVHKLLFGLTREKIYTTAMRKEFGCRSFSNQEGARKLYHPAGDWFPTLRSFFYHVDSAISLEEIVKTRMGDKRYHTEAAPDQGRRDHRCRSDSRWSH